MSRRHGRATLPFGKYRGVQVRLVPDGYLSWLGSKFTENAICAVEPNGDTGFNLNNPKWNWLRESVLAEMRYRGLYTGSLLADDLCNNFADTVSDNPSEWGWPIHDKAHVRLAIKAFNDTPPAKEKRSEIAAKILAAAERFGITNFVLGKLEIHGPQATLPEFHSIAEVTSLEIATGKKKIKLGRGQVYWQQHPDETVKAPRRRILLES